MKLYLDQAWPRLRGRPVRWLIAPDARGSNPLLAWTQAENPETIFVANTSLERASGGFGLPGPAGAEICRLEYSTVPEPPAGDRELTFNGIYFPVTNLAPADGRAYQIG